MITRHEHSGKLLPHRHTSYAGIAMLLLVTTVILASVSFGSRADSSESLVSLTVNGPAPTQPAVITSPTDDQDFSDNTIIVSGTCPTGTRVEITRNSVFAGAVLCQNDSSFTLTITLVSGSNILSAQDYDGLNQAGPTSAPVTVTYTPPAVPPSPPTPPPASPPSPSPAPNINLPSQIISNIGAAFRQLVGQRKPTTRSRVAVVPNGVPLTLSSPIHFQPSVGIGQPLSWQLLANGGTPPYALNWDWGDGLASLVSSTQTSITAQHHYAFGGQFPITVTATDISGQIARLQLFIVVAGEPAAASSSDSPAPSPQSSDPLAWAWPILGTTALLATCFWLGERYQLSDWKFHRQPA